MSLAWFKKWFTAEATRRERRAGHTVVCFQNPKTWRELHDPNGFLRALDALYFSMTDLVGTPPGETDCLIYRESPGDYGALWAMDAEADYHIGIAVDTMPRLLAAINRRPIAAALVHEIGHLAMRWDWDPLWKGTYLQWPGAVEGLATPTGTYALVTNNLLPAHTDVTDGSRDWLTVEDFASEWINQGLHHLESGTTGQDSVLHGGHHPSTKVVEGTMFDLLFNAFGSYEPLRVTFREYLGRRSLAGYAGRADRQKMEDFFIALGRHAGYNIGEHLRGWGFASEAINRALADLPLPAATRPVAPLEVRYTRG